jgi:hypothetical protein
VCSPLLDAPQLIVNYVVVERVLGAVELLVLFAQFLPQLCLVHILRRLGRCRCEAQRGINLITKLRAREIWGKKIYFVFGSVKFSARAKADVFNEQSLRNN